MTTPLDVFRLTDAERVRLNDLPFTNTPPKACTPSPFVSTKRF